MKKFLAKFIAATLTLTGGMLIVLAPQTYALESSDPCDRNLPAAVLEANNCSGTSGSTSRDVRNVIIDISNALIGVLSVVAVIVIVVGGVRYMTSAGDASKLQKAKSTIIYAVIGLIICALAGVLVNSVVKAVVRAETAGTYASQRACEREGYNWTGTKCE